MSSNEKEVKRLKKLYPNYNIVCKIDYYNDLQGNYSCINLDNNEVIYNAHVMAPDIQKIVETSLNSQIKGWEKEGKKVKKIINSIE